ncbi:MULTISPECIES: DUF4911 domain-containing protein [unclassified Mesotoga]|uniref:DUF4911 domain-containing protein n=1 Tax=unclassified Mesotoga TaxID=1184398 RepID=UPI000DA6DA56|nr:MULTISPECIES: DUF4911 domain-containing protein [unclassified Mesotoga]PZC52593.1 hypothetical protein LH53_03675 [Mesotoga sp. TolDC]
MNRVAEYDLFVKIRPEDIHVLCYIAEAEDNLMNIRHVTDEDLLKIIVPADLLDEVKSFLKSIKNRIDLEVVEIRANPGHT